MTDTAAPPPSPSAPPGDPIHTYHCRQCSHLLLASTHSLTLLPRRAGPAALDKATILPLPPPPPEQARGPASASASASEDEPEPEPEPEDEPEPESETADGADAKAGPERRRRDRAPPFYALLLNVLGGDRRAGGSNAAGRAGAAAAGAGTGRPLIVTRADGFEKRFRLRCARCRVVVGYQLEAGQFGGGRGAPGGGPRTDVAYVLDGAVMSTEEMRGLGGRVS
ncbi:hypothetical protein BDY21DRAFT_365729 [Lineolata rhizophorae]|uniref:STEEP1 domain-containing protein n=1 Tax=Lineolata rhizophorae TaxID=578093 RepID=A0A6A6NTN9_9PEZI|nr:hypothetical protein BDY21DRAFT_365729 [Lineolata rhizophorae]